LASRSHSGLEALTAEFLGAIVNCFKHIKAAVADVDITLQFLLFPFHVTTTSVAKAVLTPCGFWLISCVTELRETPLVLSLTCINGHFVAVSL